ncbi:methyltransferase [Halobacteriales archaeon QH_7_68_42]|nr:MAG: methyltransferase [Halobacteriales archaeon QH_7_68_42]
MDGNGNEVPSLAEQRGVDVVYDPAEDSELLADAVVEGVAAGDLLLDVGTGSGYVARRARKAGAEVVGSEINPHACEHAAEMGVPVVRADLTTAFRDDAFDAVAFNPPYLPEPEGGGWGDWLETAITGGEDGRAVVEPFLDDVGRVLAPGGRVYLLVSTMTGPDEVREYAAARGLDAPIGLLRGIN